MTKEASAEATVRNICRNSRRKYSTTEKIRIVLESIRGDRAIAELALKNKVLKKACLARIQRGRSDAPLAS